MARAGTPPLLFVTGPTGVGKSELALSLAQRIGAEIISCDSRQVYRQLTIGTAKPSDVELRSVRHHFVDELDLGEPFSAGLFARRATERMATLETRGKLAIVVGGSTLYLKALAHGLSNVPQTSATTRAALTERLSIEGREALFEELQQVDPASAATMDASKTQRVVRALEVFHDTGRPLSSFHDNSPPIPFSPIVVVLNRDRSILYDRINRRVDLMLEAGLLAENGAILKAGYPAELNPLRTIGYQEPRAFLRGEISHDAMVGSLKQNTRRYAKRQLTWFRRHESYQWISLDEGVDRSEREILELWEKHANA